MCFDLTDTKAQLNIFELIFWEGGNFTHYFLNLGCLGLFAELNRGNGL